MLDNVQSDLPIFLLVLIARAGVGSCSCFDGVNRFPDCNAVLLPIRESTVQR